MNAEILCQLNQRLLALDRGRSHFRLECRAVSPPRSFCHGHLLACSIMRLLRGKSTYPIESIEEAQDQATQWLWTYNNDRPNIPLTVCRQTAAGQRGIGGITPAMKLKIAA